MKMAGWASELIPSDVPSAVLSAASDAFIDTIGVILAGATDGLAPVIEGWIRERPDPKGPLVPPFGYRTPPEVAAFALGTLAHAIDLDDAHPSMNGHPSAVLVPVVLSLGQAVDATWEDALLSYVVGAELCMHLGRAVAVHQFLQGFHATSTVGVIGAAGAAGKILQLDAVTTSNALGIAASSAAGIGSNFGSKVKALHVGQAAEHGVLSAILASRGFTATPGALGAPRGYLSSFTGQASIDSEAIWKSLGERWELVDPGLIVKEFACCGAATRPVEAMTDLINETDLEAREVKSIVALISPHAAKLLVFPRPQTVDQARFSLHHCLAATLVDRELRLDHFSEEAIGRQDLHEVRRKIEIRIHPDLQGLSSGFAFAEIRLTMSSGEVLTQRSEHIKGSVERPFSRDELDSKFLKCARLYSSRHDWSPLLQTLRNQAPRSPIRDLVEEISIRA